MICFFKGVVFDLNRFNIRFYFVIFFIFFAVVGVGYIVLTDNKSSADDIDYYYAELKDKHIFAGELESTYIYEMKVLYKDNASEEPIEHIVYQVAVKKDVYNEYGVRSILKGYFDAQGKLFLAGLSKDEPYEGLQPH